MANLLSPKPLSFAQQPLSYPNYQNGGLSSSNSGGLYGQTPPPDSSSAFAHRNHGLIAQQRQNQIHQQRQLNLFSPSIGIGGGGMTGSLGGGLGSAPGMMNISQYGGHEEERIYGLVMDLLNSNTRDAALLELSKKREQYDDLALVLWHSFGTMTSLLQEIVSVYPLLSPPNLTAHVSNRVCNALALLQCVASHSETRQLFLTAHIPLFLYPFLNTTSKTRPFEYLRLTSLGVIGALVKQQSDNNTVIHFLLSTEIIPLCLRIMETGSELSKTVAIFIVQKILLDETGLTYICHTYERFLAVVTVLSNMVNQLVESQAVRLLKHVVRCYLRLSDNNKAREALKSCLPEALSDGTFNNLLKGDMVTKRCLTTLLQNLAPPSYQNMRELRESLRHLQDTNNTYNGSGGHMQPSLASAMLLSSGALGGSAANASALNASSHSSHGLNNHVAYSPTALTSSLSTLLGLNDPSGRRSTGLSGTRSPDVGGASGSVASKAGE